jgi:short-subunit dehydrogenase
MADRAVVITGASGGIGLAFAEIFASDGWRPILVARSVDKLESIADGLKLKHGAEAAVVGLDLAQPGAAQRLFDAVSELGIEVDALVNNAGFATYGPFAEQLLEDERQEITLNVLTLTELTKLFLTPMLARKRGRILNVASTAGFQPGPMMAVYYATKAYILSFSEALSNELEGSGVSATCLCPGATATGFGERAKMQASPLMKSPNVADAPSVARAGYRAMMAGKRLEIPGLANQAIAMSHRFAPRGLVLKIARAFNVGTK